MNHPCPRCLANGHTTPRPFVCTACRALIRGQEAETHAVTLPFGHLPTASYFALHSGLSPADARNTLTEMRAHLRKNGPTDGLRDALLLCGFRWHDAPKLPDAKLQEDIDAVAAALGDADGAA